MTNYSQTKGLNNEQVQQRVKAGKINRAVESASKTTKQIVLSNIFTYFNLIFMVIALALIIFGQFADLTFLIVIIFNTAIGIFQEISSKKTLDELSLLNSPNATVIREGKYFQINTESLVIDDVILLGSGNQICADAVVLEGEITVNEALVTGESDEITKKPGDKLLSGSFVISGKCHAKLTAVGKDSFVSKLTIDAKKMKKVQKAGMMKSLTRLVQIIGILIIPIAIFMMINARSEGTPWGESVSTTAGALLGMIPEGLYLLTTVALAVSVRRLARKNTLVHDLGCIETLARVDVLCVDKTGTITESTMKVIDVLALSNTISTEELNVHIGNLVNNLEPDNDTMKALHEHFKTNYYSPASKVVPFSSRYKYSAATIGNTGYVIGAPEFILGARYSQYKSLIDEQTFGGCRVLLFATYGSVLDGQSLNPTQVNPVGLVKLINPVRENAPKTFTYFKEQGVQIKVISGDNPRTASQAAIQANISNADKYVDLSTFSTDKEVEEAATKYTVFGRVTPDKKRVLIKALQAKGHTVAMTGDGVNDVLALKEADCSIAMASGSEVAAQVADLVLMNSDFSSLPSVVDEGRRVINNIERTASLFLVKNIFSFIFAVLSIMFSFSYPIKPASLTLVNTVTIGIPSFFLALEPNHAKITGKFLRNVLYRAAPAALCDVFVLIGATLFRAAYKIPDEETTTICIVLIGIVGLIMLLKVCKPFNWMRIAIMVTMPILFLLGLTVIPQLFHIVPISFGSWLVMCTFAMLAVPVMIAFTWLFSKAAHLYRKIVKINTEKSLFW